MRPDGQEFHDFSNQPPGEPPGGGPPTAQNKRQRRTTIKRTVANSSAIKQRTTPPPSNGPKVMSASSSTQTPKAEVFYLTLNDDMNDAQDGLGTVFAEEEQATYYWKKQ